MKTPSEHVHVTRASVIEIAQRVRERRVELHLKQDQLAERCNAARVEVVPAADRNTVGKFSRTWIVKLESLTKTQPPRDCAKGLHPYQINILAHALEMPYHLLRGNADRTPLYLDPTTEPNRAAELLEALKYYQDRATELLSWADFIPCSLEPEDFMHGHHASSLSDTVLSPEELDTVVTFYDAFGNARRNAFGKNRKWFFHHIVDLSDIRKIADPKTDEYRLCTADLRRACFNYLLDRLNDPAWMVTLSVVLDKRIPKPLKVRLAALDTIFTFDDKFALTRTRWGDLHWSTSRPWVLKQRQTLEQLQSISDFNKLEDVNRLLKKLSDSLLS